MSIPLSSYSCDTSMAVVSPLKLNKLQCISAFPLQDILFLLESKKHICLLSFPHLEHDFASSGHGVKCDCTNIKSHHNHGDVHGALSACDCHNNKNSTEDEDDITGCGCRCFTIISLNLKANAAAGLRPRVYCFPICGM